MMYHSISDERESGHPYFWINTSPKRFTAHMKYLYDNNYHVISLAEAVELIRSPNPVAAVVSNSKRETRNAKRGSSDPQSETRNPVVLTFDDGYQDFYTRAFPVIKQYGFTATVFLPTDFIGNSGPGLCCKQHLTWEEVRELAGQGITFGSHTCTHPQLHDVGREELKDELTRSRSVIEKEVGSCGEFCYPYKFPDQDARFTSTLSETLTSLGYSCCLTTRIGVDHEADDLFGLKRIPINSGDDLIFFDAKLNGAYNWLYGFQSVVKGIRERSKAHLMIERRPIRNNHPNG